MGKKILLAILLVFMLSEVFFTQSLFKEDLFFSNPVTTSNDPLCHVEINNSILLGAEAGTILSLSTTTGEVDVQMLPTNYDIVDISFYNDNIGYLLTKGSYLYNYFNEVFLTTDGGANWQKINFSGTAFSQILAVDENTLLVLGVDSQVKRSTDAGNTWSSSLFHQYDRNITSAEIYNDVIYLTSHQRGFVRSTDFGITWEDLSAETLVYTLLSTSPLPEDNKILLTGESGNVYIFETIEKTFSSIHTGEYSKRIMQAAMIDENIYAVGRDYGSTADESVLIKYNTADSTWTLIREYQALFDGISAFSGNEVLIYGEDHLTIYTDISTGDYRKVVEDEISSSIVAMSALSKENCWALTKNGEVIYSNNIGQGWEIIYNFDNTQFSSSDGFLSIEFFNPNIGWITRQSNHDLKFYKTTNSGHDWTEINVPRFGKYQAMEFVSADTGFIARDPKFMLKTTNGGNTWTNHGILSFSYTNGQTIDAMQFLNSNVGYAVGGYIRGLDPWGSYLYEGVVIKTTDSGESWDVVFDAYDSPGISAHAYFTSLSFIDEQTGYVSEGNVIIKTTDGGLTWSSSTTNFPSIDHIYFEDAQNGWGAGWMGGLYQTANGGQSWAKLSNITNKDFNGIAQVEGSLFFAYGQTGSIIRHGEATLSLKDQIPESFYVSQNYPNPFNGTTQIRFVLDNRQHVKIDIYDVLGKLVFTAADQIFSEGENSITINSSGLTSGVYFYKISTKSGSVTKKMVLLK
ncbi:MAG: hypothetical protein SCALA702_09190 [Melioribacteraceae bacterium]|nr:MAG: hypothetical protein SCALA702_09190 [Melioribacteraceae bacterium]